MPAALPAAEIERTMQSIFKRCVSCPPQTPTCPDCPSGQICSLVPASCDACQQMVCIANPGAAPPSESTNVGAIVGGVIGGIAFMALLTFFIWRFCIKRREVEDDPWPEVDTIRKKGSRLEALRSDAASTRTRGSIATSILSRASNIIHIAYFPGVMNRSGSNSVLANTPVPPIPAQYQSSPARSPLSTEGDALFFRPGSSYSDASSVRSSRNRDTQYTVQSITPSLARSSMMSEVYRDDATTEPMPATQLFRAAPRMVSVRGSASPSPASSPRLALPQSQALNSLQVAQRGSGGQFARAAQVTVGNGKGRFPVAHQHQAPSKLSPARAKHVPAASSPLVATPVESDDDDDDDEHARARRSLVQAVSRAAEPAPLIQPLESPFYDALDLQASPAATLPPPNPYAAMSSNVRAGPAPGRAEVHTPGGLSAVIEEASRRASPASLSPGAADRGDESPASDVGPTTPLTRKT